MAERIGSWLAAWASAVVERPRLEHEEAAVHVGPGAIAVGFLVEGGDPGAIVTQGEGAEAAGRLHGREGGADTLPAVERDCLGDVQVAHAVAVGEAEALRADIVANPLDAAAGHRLLAGVHQGHAPGLGDGVVHLHTVVAHVEGDIGGVQEVVGEEVLDRIALVAQADDEVLNTVGRVLLHDVPENRLATDLDHRLGLEVRFLADAGAQAAGQDHCFHCCSPCSQ